MNSFDIVSYRYIMLSCMVMCNVLQNNCTPLHFATSNNHAPLVEALVQAGADVNVINKVKQNDYIRS